MFRFLAACGLVACGQTTLPNVDFACGDAAICHSSSEYCELASTSGGVPKDSGAPSPPIAQCAPLVAGCTTCDCLADAGALGACTGQHATCTEGSSGAITFAFSCPL